MNSEPQTDQEVENAVTDDKPKKSRKTASKERISATVDPKVLTELKVYCLRNKVSLSSAVEAGITLLLSPEGN